MRTLARALALLSLGACSESPLTLEIVVGAETDAMTVEPAVARVDITVVGSNGNALVKATAAPGGSFDLGELSADAPIVVEVDGKTLAGERVLSGRSLVFTTRGLEGQTLPIFVQRLDGWARPPKALARAHTGGCAAVLGERFLFTTGGTAADADGPTDAQESDSYDLLALGPAVGDRLAHLGKSLVARGDVLLVIGDDGATLVDLALGESNEVPLPDGLDSFASVAGGRVVDTDDGRTFIVGPAREGLATSAVLAVDSQFVLSHHILNTPRSGATAAWVPGLGLVVAGGSVVGAGVELLSGDSTLFAALPFDPDPVEGAAAVLVDAVSLALVGGTDALGAAAPTRVLSPACVSACVVTPLLGAELPVALRGSTAYRVAPGHALVVGNDGDADRSFDVTISGTPAVVERALRVPRSGATLLPAPNGTLALLGGTQPGGAPALEIETFFPE